MRYLNYLIFIGLIVEIIGLYWSKTVLSIVPYAMLIIGLLRTGASKKTTFFFQDISFISLFLIFFVYVLSGINSENSPVWINRLNTNLLYLSFPLALYLNGPYSKRFFHNLLAIFILINFILCLYLFYNYLINFEYFNELYLSGQTIKTPIFHIRFSHFMLLSLIFSYYLYLKKYEINKVNLKYILLVITIFMSIGLHILAVRSGILGFYMVIITLGVLEVKKSKKYNTFTSASLIIVYILTLTIHYIPSFSNKIEYTKKDIINSLNSESRENTSDRIRIASIKNGLEIWKSSPFLGCGIGDLENEMNKKYDQNYPTLPQELRFEPDNQYIFTFTSMGLVGFALFFILLFIPLVRNFKFSKLIFPFYIVTLTFFLGEPTIELLVGKSVFLLFLSFFIMLGD